MFDLSIYLRLEQGNAFILASIIAFHCLNLGSLVFRTHLTLYECYVTNVLVSRSILERCERKKDVFVQVEDLACVLKKSQNRKKFICKNDYTFLCVHIKMHIFQDQSQEAFDAFMHLWLVHLYFSFLRVKSLLFDVIGTWRNQLH